MTELDHILRVLRTGGVILYPTDTIWGLGCDATNADAVNRILLIKGQTTSLPLVLLADGIEMLNKYVHTVHPRIETLIHYHQRPLTVIYERGRYLPAAVCAEDGSVAIRVTVDPFCREIIGELGKPLVGTSASLPGAVYPSHFYHIQPEITSQVDYIVKYRQDEPSTELPSVMVRLTEKAELDFVRE